MLFTSGNRVRKTKDSHFKTDTSLLLADMEILESRYYYLILLALTLFGPFLSSFESKLRFYRRWPALLGASGLMMLLFIPWDVYFTHEGVWWFNDHYLTGIRIFLLPLEEWLFFILVPYACVFVYEVLQYVFPDLALQHISRMFFALLIPLLLGLMIYFHDAAYTAVNFFITSVLLLLFVVKAPAWMGHFFLMYIVISVPFVIINGGLTGSFTDAAVVNYNPSEIMGVRLGTIPLEDSMYNLSMLLVVVWSYEWIKTRFIKNGL